MKPWVDLSHEQTLFYKRTSDWINSTEGEKFPFSNASVMETFFRLSSTSPNTLPIFCNLSLPLTCSYSRRGASSPQKLSFQHLVIFEPKVATSPLDVITAEMVPNKKALGTPRQANLISEIGTKINCVWTA